jgi:hypothetical protein
MTDNPQDNDLLSKETTNQIHSSEPSMIIFNKLNSIAKGNFHQILPTVVCEICYKDKNLLVCNICRNGFHKKCLNTAFLPEPFICSHCKNQFTEEEIKSLLNNPYSQSQKDNVDKNKLYKEYEQKKSVKKKYQINTTTGPTKIIELEDNINENNAENKQGSIINTNNINKKKSAKKIADNNYITDNMSESNFNDNCDKSETKSIKKEKKLKIEIEKNGLLGNSIENELCESSVMSRSQEITLEKQFINNKRKKEPNSNFKNKNANNNRKKVNSPIEGNSKIESFSNSNMNNIQISNKEKIIKDEQSLQSTTKKSGKRKSAEQKGEKDSLLLSFTHTDPQYKRRKIKLGSNRQCNMYEFTDKYENKINFDEEEYERNDLIQVWSKEKNPLSEEDLNKYIETAKIFWNYRNVHIEEDLCSDFFHECETKMKNKKIVPKLKNKIMKLIKELKELIKRGISLNSHYDEMSLRVLHLCKYKTNIALLILYKGLNPFIEEVEEGFRHDIYFFQDEIYSFINNGDYFDPDN